MGDSCFEGKFTSILTIYFLKPIKVYIPTIAGFQCHAIQNRLK